jgi:hypothetical protein
LLVTNIIKKMAPSGARLLLKYEFILTDSVNNA